MGESKVKAGLGSFSNVDATGEASSYVAYLDRATTTLKDLRAFSAALLQLKTNDHVLDVGCGTGDAVREMAAIVGPQGRAVGVDSSAAMIAEAIKRSASSPSVEFKVGDAYRLDFPDNHFSGTTAERVFVHLTEPRQAVAEMVRVTRPAGHIVINDPDLDMIALDASDRVTTRAICRTFADQMRNGSAGRQLYRLLLEAGLDEVAVYPRPVILYSWAAMNALFPFEDFARAAVAHGENSQDAVDAVVADLRERDEAGRFFVCYIVFIAAGRKP